MPRTRPVALKSPAPPTSNGMDHEDQGNDYPGLGKGQTYDQSHERSTLLEKDSAIRRMDQSCVDRRLQIDRQTHLKEESGLQQCRRVCMKIHQFDLGCS